MGKSRPPPWGCSLPVFSREPWGRGAWFCTEEKLMPSPAKNSHCKINDCH